MKKFRNFFVEDIPRRKFLQVSLKGGIALAAAPSLMTQLLSCKKAGTLSTKLELDPVIYDKTIRKALDKGGDFADVYVENRISRNIIMEESKFKSADFGISQGAGVRVISRDKTGFAYTDDVSEENLLKAAEVAAYIALGAQKTEPVKVKEQSRQSFITVALPLEDIADEKRLEVMQRANQDGIS
jgi:TldD protein